MSKLESMSAKLSSNKRVNVCQSISAVGQLSSSKTMSSKLESMSANYLQARQCLPTRVNVCQAILNHVSMFRVSLSSSQSMSAKQANQLAQCLPISRECKPAYPRLSFQSKCPQCHPQPRVNVYQPILKCRYSESNVFHQASQCLPSKQPKPNVCQCSQCHLQPRVNVCQPISIKCPK